MRIASCVHRKVPLRLVSTTAFHFSYGRSSIGTGGAPMPALLNRTSSRPNACLVVANSVLIDAGSAMSAGTTKFFPPSAPPGQHHGEPGLHQRQRGAAADAGAGPGDDGDFRCRGHGAPPLWSARGP